VSSDAKASTAGSTRRRAPRRKPGLLLVCLAACVAALAVVVGSASASKSHPFKEIFGSAAQPTITTPRSVAVDQSSGDVLVMQASSPPSIKRYNPDGTPHNFSALGTNVIDGKEGPDATPQAGLSFASASESQIAIDNSGGVTDGDIYVTQGSPNRINIFASTGAYLGQLSAAGATSFAEACGVAVDPSGAVYVGDYSSGIKKFVPAANPVVNADHTATFTTTTQPCTLAAGAGATAGFLFPAQYNGAIRKIDSATGELKYTVSSDSHTTVSVDPTSGHVYGATGSNIKEFDASGAGSASALSATKLANTVQGVAVRGSSGDIFVTRSGSSNVEVFGSTILTFPDVVTTAVSNNTGVHATLNGTVNPDGLELDECFFEWGVDVFGPDVYGNTVPCAETPAAIGTGSSPVAVHADISNLQPNGTKYEYRLVAVNPDATVKGANKEFTTPNTVITGAASGITPTAATLNGTVNPDGVAITECVFEWGLPKEAGEKFQKYPETAPCVPGPGGIGTGTSAVAVTAGISGLHPGTTYVYRLRAANANGPILGAQKSVQSSGPVIVGAWAQDVVRTEATLKVKINPTGQATTYHFEYGTSEAYGSETEEANVGSDSSVHTLERFLTGLEPDTTYHYRAVATNGAAENIGPDQSFTTYATYSVKTDCPNQSHRYGPGVDLPDCRGYEMVSPIDKGGGDIRTQISYGLGDPYLTSEMNQASLAGDKYTFSSYRAFAGALGNPYTSQYLATRGPEGWTTEAISPPHTSFPGLGGALSYTLEGAFRGFNDDLSRAWVIGLDPEPLTPDGLLGAANLYERDNVSGSLRALTTGEIFATKGTYSPAKKLDAAGESADGSTAVFDYEGALTPDAAPDSAHYQVYARRGDDLELVSVLPNGQPAPGHSSVGNGGFAYHGGAQLTHAISADGSRIFWATTPDNVIPFFTSKPGKLYVRVDGETTVPVSENDKGWFWTATPDGSEAIYAEDVSTLVALNVLETTQDLYRFDVDSETRTPIAGEVLGVLGASEDLSRLYYISREALAPGSVEGEPNLYLDEEGAITLVAVLADADVLDLVTNPGARLPLHRNGRVTEDGGHIAFMSIRSLTGYDNTDADGTPPGTKNGEADFEVFRYDADADQLTCVSCNPSGARPKGRLLWPPFSVDRTEKIYTFSIEEYSAAAWLPSWENSLHASRALSEDGHRVFFNSFDALVPEDNNGVQDVYQWEEQGSGTCEKPAGCISLISTGQSPEDSSFMDADPSGDRVFIRTGESIHPEDPQGRDIYAAVVDGGYPPPPPPLPPCVGDACQNIPAAPDDPTPASAGFRGAGDPQPRRDCGAQARRAARLARQAKRLRRAAARSGSAKRSRRLRRRSAQAATRAKRLSAGAKRCRRTNRRANR
jgi:hypothetical protein